MLLVNHYEPEVCECDFVVKQRVSSNDDLWFFAGRQGFLTHKKRQWSAFLLTSGGSQRQAHAQRLEPAPQDIIMLLRQDLCRRHERSLIAALDGEQHCSDSDNGLSRAYVAL